MRENINVEQSDRAEIGGMSPMMFGGSFCQVLLGVLAKFRSPPISLIAGVRHSEKIMKAATFSQNLL